MTKNRHKKNHRIKNKAHTKQKTKQTTNKPNQIKQHFFNKTNILKMNKKIKFMMVAAAAIAMIGCAKDGGKNNGPKEPAANTVKTLATVAIKKAPGTRADGTATGDEVKLNEVQLFVFDANKQLEQIQDLTSVIGQNPQSKSFETTNGLHTLIVLANMPAWMKTSVDGLTSLKEYEADPVTNPQVSMYGDFLTATTFPAWTTQAGFETAMGIGQTQGMFITSVVDGKYAIGALYPSAGTYYDAANAANNKNSFDYTFAVPTETNPNPEANSITINLGRGFAKAEAEWNSVGFDFTADTDADTNNDTYGSLSKLEFAMLHIPNKSYGPQNIVNNVYQGAYHALGLSYTPANFYNWAESDDTAGVVFENPEKWNIADVTNNNNFTYIPENTNPSVEGHRTAMGFKGTFVPDNIYKTTLAGSAATGDYENDGSWAAGSDFYRIKGLKTIAGVPASAEGWKNVYFSAKPDASVTAQMAVIRKALGYTAAHQAIANPVEGTDFEIYKYTNAACYYYLGLEDVTKPVGKTNIGRNEFFAVQINRIQTIGEPTLIDATPEETEPLTTPVNITATIKVQNWVLVPIDSGL
jgi:hypothetical protein